MLVVVMLTSSSWIFILARVCACVLAAAKLLPLHTSLKGANKGGECDLFVLLPSYNHNHPADEPPIGGGERK